MSADERRKATRHPIGVRIEFDSGSGLSRDVSGLGVYFHTTSPLSVGDELDFLMVIPDAVNVRCQGRVVRVEGTEGPFGIAATIDNYALADGDGAGKGHFAHLIIRELRAHDASRDNT